MNRYLLGIDIGTSGCKCCVTNEGGKVIASKSNVYEPLIIRQGWIEQDPSVWYKTLIVTLNQLKTDLDLKGIVAIGVTGQMRGVTLIDSSGQVIRNSILWNDLRNTSEVDEINRDYADVIQRVTQNPLNTMCTLPKILWILRHEPENWARTHKVIFPKDYINLKLTGNIFTDLSDASGTSFYDIHQQNWSDEILDAFSISRDKLPDIRQSTSVIGELSAQAAADTGIAMGIPVVAGGSDATVESFSIGLLNSSQCKIRLGTSGALSTIVDSDWALSNSMTYCWSYVIRDRWMLDVNTRSCAQAVKWLRDVFYGDRPKTGVTYDEIDDEALNTPLGSEGLIFHPYLVGEDAPYWDSQLKGNFLGIAANHARSHFARAVYEGTAYALRDARSAFGRMAEDFKEYIFTGGGVKSKCWLSIVADVLGIDGAVSANTDAALGASILAGVGIGIFADMEQAMRLCKNRDFYIEYSRENHKIYNELFDNYKRMKDVCDRYRK